MPVFLDMKEEAAWTHFCKSCLWPLLNSQLVSSDFDYDLWHAYKECNQKMAEAVYEVCTSYRGEDLIWIHDYHLQLVPTKLRRMKGVGLNTRIGFFSHTPFPTSEIFRILPIRAKLLEGVLGADLIGFQTYHDCRHFLSACTRILALDSRPKGVEWAGRMVAVDIFPVGIDPDGLEKVMESEPVKERVKELKKQFEGQKILMGRDRLDPIKGIPHKLLALEDFFERYPEWQGKVVLFQVCLPPRFNTLAQNDAQELSSQINELVGKINGKYSSADFTPIHYLHQHLPITEVCALYTAADVALLTPLRDGMNLTSHEYVTCQRDNHGPLILSEFAGSAQSLGGAVLVNPWDTKGVATAIHQALLMSETERKLKHEYNYRYIKRNTALLWGKTFLGELMRLERFSKVPPLNFDDVVSKYQSCREGKKRLFLLDYDGTLTPIVKNPVDAVPSPRLVEALRRLCDDPKNIVYVISGRDRDFLQQWLGYLPIGLSCEHGLFFRPYGGGRRRGSGSEIADGNEDGEDGGNNNAEWEDLLSGMEFSWKDVVLPILEDYTERTPGSMIETKEVNLAWHYRCAEADFASFQAKELVVHLQNVASKLPIEILLGKKAIEIRPQNVNKGATVRKILSRHPLPDFILCLGDDRTDEDMFMALHGALGADEKTSHSFDDENEPIEGSPEQELATASAQNEQQQKEDDQTERRMQVEEEEENNDDDDDDDDDDDESRHKLVDPQHCACFTCVVNKQDSQAKYFIPNQKQALSLLKLLSRNGKKEETPQLSRRHHPHSHAGASSHKSGVTKQDPRLSPIESHDGVIEQMME
ncbi:alpha,alpha-trehalose-phosphate synthase (UDP-forming), variant 2 [Balamuthia mandrillaris]